MNISNTFGTAAEQSGAAKLYFDGTHRSRAPEDTLTRVEPYFPLMGITRIADVTGLDRIGIPVTIVCRPNSRSVAISQGKGTTIEAAKASGVMESIETYHAEHITLPLKFASLEEVRYSHPLIDLDDLPEVGGGCFHPHLQLMWIEGVNLLCDEPVWLPFELVHTNYTRPMPPGSGSFMASSNGLASGNTFTEAVSHAICEVVERDAVALWSQSSDTARSERRIRPETITDPNCRGLLDKYERAGIQVAVWDVTSDTGIAAILVWIMEDGSRERLLARPSVGAGCHPVREVALSRALTEAAQERLTLITGSRDDLQRDYYGEMSLQHVFDAAGDRDFMSVPTRCCPSAEDDVDWLLGQLKSVGVEQVVTVDLSQEVFRQIAVARVVIPKLEGVVDDARYVPGARAAALREAAS
ncbi:MAG: YcaO-like family protein [Pseudomonadota bacterium]